MRRALLLVACLAVAVPAFAIWPFSKPSYVLTVVGGSGGGSYKAGTVVPITALSIPPGAFVAWLSGGPAAWGSRPQDFANPNAVATTFTMPKHAETIQVTYSTPIP